MDVRFAPSSIRYLDIQLQNVRSKLINDVVWLSKNPHLSPHDTSKRPFNAPPLVFHEYRDDFHWIIYYLDANTLVIANIGSISETSHLTDPLMVR